MAPCWLCDPAEQSRAVKRKKISNKTAAVQRLTPRGVSSIAMADAIRKVTT